MRIGKRTEIGLTYRNLDDAQRDEQPAWFEDERLNLITDRVIDYLEGTPVIEWQGDMWSIFKALWASRSKGDGGKRKMNRHIALQSTEQLKKLMEEQEQMRLDEIKNY